MEIVNTTAVLPTGQDVKAVLRQLREAGFTRLDMGLDGYEKQVQSENYEAWAADIREEAERLGLVFSHSHACFVPSGMTLDLPERNLRCLRCAEILGAEYMVVHPIWRKCYADTEEESFLHGEEFIETNVQAILPLLEPAERHGVTLLTENLQFGGSRYPEVITELLDRVNSPRFGWCFDTGHACTKGIDMERLTRGRTPLSLHVHDDLGEGNDLHLSPGMGIIDWDKFLRILRDIGYRGDFVLEASAPFCDIPDTKTQNHYLHVLYTKAHRMVQQFEGKA